MKKSALILVAIFMAMILTSTANALPSMTETIYTDWTFGFLQYGGDNHTYDYASYINFSDTDYGFPDWMTGTRIGTSSSYPSTLSYGHTLPSGLTVPPDQILSAKLWIDGWLIEDDDNYIQIEDAQLVWDPLNNWSFLGFGDNSLYDLTNVSVPGFWNNSPLDITITAGERLLRIDRSILMMDYSSEPIPEPATLTLLGLGLLGSGILMRKRS